MSTQRATQGIPAPAPVNPASVWKKFSHWPPLIERYRRFYFVANAWLASWYRLSSAGHHCVATHMITPSQARQFAETWINTWNTRDLAQILSLYTKHFTMSSPKIVHFVGEPSGKLRGKAAVAAYWKRALDLRPDLHFRLLEVYAGVDTICVTYESLDGQHAAEWFTIDDNFKIRAAAAHYASPA